MANQSFLDTYADALETIEARFIAAGREVPTFGELTFSFAGRRYRADYKAGKQPAIYEVSPCARYARTGSSVETRVY